MKSSWLENNNSFPLREAHIFSYEVYTRDECLEESVSEMIYKNIEVITLKKVNHYSRTPILETLEEILDEI